MAATLSQLFVGLFNAATGGYKSEFTTAQANELANVAGIVLGQDLRSDKDYINYVLGNLGVSSTNAVYTAAFTAMQGLVTAQGRGNAVLVAADFLQSQSTVTSSPYYAVATAFVAKVAVADAFTAANPSATSVASLQAGAAGQGDNVVLTTGIDSHQLTSKDNIITALFIAADDAKNTLNATDSLFDATTTDSDALELTIKDDLDSTTDTGTITNIENINIKVDALTSSVGTATLTVDGADISGATAYSIESVAAQTAINKVVLVNANSGSTVTAGTTFKTVEVRPTLAKDVSVNVLYAGTSTSSANVDLTTVVAKNATLTGAGYLDIDTTNNGVLTANAKSITALTAASAKVINATATAGKVVIDDATAALLITATASGDVSLASAGGANTFTATAGGKVEMATGGTTKATLSATGTSVITANDDLATLAVSGNGAAAKFEMSGSHGALATILVSGSQDVTVTVNPIEAGADAASLSVIDGGTGTVTLNLGTAVTHTGTAGTTDMTDSDIVDVLNVNIDMDSTVLTVPSGQTVNYTKSQTDTAGGTATQLAGPSTSNTTNSATIVLNDGTRDIVASSSNRVDLTGLVLTNIKTLTVDASQDLTRSGTANPSTISGLNGSDEKANVTVNTGINGLTLAGINTLGATGTLKVTGSGAVVLGTSTLTADTFDASEVSGKVSGTAFNIDEVSNILTGSGNDTLTIGAAAAASVTVDMGAGNDVLTLEEIDFGVAATVVAFDFGDGDDTLSLADATGIDLDKTTGGSITFSNLENITYDASGTQTIQDSLLNGATYNVKGDAVGASGTVAITVASTTTSIDLSQLVGSRNASDSVTGMTYTVDASANTAAAITVTGALDSKNTITGSAAAGDVLTGGAYADNFVVKTDASLFDADGVMLDTIAGGATTVASTYDSITLGTGGTALTIAATDEWSKLSGVEQLAVADNSAVISITLSASAQTAGISRVTLAGDSTNDEITNVLDVSAFTSGVTITGSANIDTITGGAGADTITAAVDADVIDAGAGDDSIVYTTDATLFDGDNASIDTSVDGGLGTDIVKVGVTTAGNTTAFTIAALDDWSAFEGVETIKSVADEAAQNITLHANAYTAGIRTVDLSAAKKATGNIIDIDLFLADQGATLIGSATGVTTFTGGAGDDTISGGTADDSFSGKEGTNTISLTAGGEDTVVTAIDGVAIVTGFQAGTDVGADILTLALLDSTDVVSASVSSDAVTIAADESITVINSILTTSLAAATDGTALLASLKAANAATDVEITADADGHTGYLVAYQGGNTYVYYFADTIEVDTGNVEADEITLVAKLVGVTSGSLDALNFG